MVLKGHLAYPVVAPISAASWGEFHTRQDSSDATTSSDETVFFFFFQIVLWQDAVVILDKVTKLTTTQLFPLSLLMRTVVPLKSRAIFLNWGLRLLHLCSW